ncbi:MAG TPA: murein biosynthesis integral membrane protein MurJ [Clostridiaceae bacterium]|nr:murein biosynthesis integral membrane protein MurJ [Clostridiaceae bacterium]
MEFPFEQDRKRRQLDSGRLLKRNHNIKAGDSRTIARATLISMIGLFMAKITGFLREVLVVPILGYGMYSDPYYIAFAIPDFLFALLIGGAVAAAITPTLSEGIEQNREREAWRSVSIFISIAGIVMMAVLGLAAILMQWLLPAINPGRLAKVINAAIPVSRILLVQCFFMTLIALTQGILTSYKRFGLAAFGVMIYNILFMIVLITFGEESLAGLKKVAWGVVGSAAIYFLFQLVLARRELKHFKFNLDYKDSGFKKLLGLAIPTLLSGSVLHLNGLIMNAFTNQFTGAITSIIQANQTFMLPYGVIAVGIGTVMLPNLTGFYAKRDYQQCKQLFTKSIRRALFLTGPIAVIFFVLDFETIQLIFQWSSKYKNSDVVITGEVLQWLCVSLIAQTIVYMTNQAFYARKVTRIALFNGIMTLILNPLFCVLFTKVFDYGVKGIAMAHAAYSVLSALIVYTLYKLHKPQAKPYRIFPFMLRLAYCLIIMGLVLSAINLIPIYPSGKVLQAVVYLIKLIIGLVVYYIAGISINLHEVIDLRNKLKIKISN